MVEPPRTRCQPAARHADGGLRGFPGHTFERTVDDKGRIVLPAGPRRDAFDGRAWISL